MHLLNLPKLALNKLRVAKTGNMAVTVLFPASRPAEVAVAKVAGSMSSRKCQLGLWRSRSRDSYKLLTTTERSLVRSLSSRVISVAGVVDLHD